MHLTMRGMLLLFLLVLFTQNYFSHGDLIADTCKKTEYPRICVSTLRSNPDSKTADVKGLVRIILKAALGKANTIFNQANDLLKKTKDRLVRQSLDVCVSVYEGALDEIPDAIANVGTNNSVANIKEQSCMLGWDYLKDELRTIAAIPEGELLLKELKIVESLKAKMLKGSPIHL